ncbi:TonB-dependent receptor [Flavihumibacter stibioxidans]
MSKRFVSVLAAVLLVFSATAQQPVIKGKVTDKSGKGLGGVSVRVLNTSLGTITGQEGDFQLAALQHGSYELELSMIGYASTVVTAQTGDKGDANTYILQIQSRQLDDVLVTAEKREGLIQKAPLSVTSLSARQVQQYRLWNAKELTAIVPNFYSNNSGDERNVTSIRGITTTSYDPAVAVYVDGVNQFSLDSYIPQLADVERIEVLRGPQGTLYGRNAMGGVINIITKQPGNTTSGFAEVNMGNYGLQRYQAGIRTPVVKGKLFAGASAVYHQRDGYYTNEFNNSSYDKQHALTGNYFLKWLPASNWSVTYNFKHQNNRNHGAFPMVFGVEDAINNAYKLNQNAVARMVDNTMNTSLSVQHQARDFNFISQTAYQTNYRYYQSPLDGDFSPLDAVEVINDFGRDWNRVKIFTQEFRFSSPAQKSSRLNWLAGAFFFRQHNPVKQATHFGEDAEMMGAPMTNFSTINTSTGKNRGMAFFGQANYAFTSKLSFIAGLRYDRENRELKVKGEFQPDGDDAFTTQPDTAATNTFSAISPKVGAAYQLDSQNNIFASFSRGFRTGGLTQLSSDPSQPPLYPYKPEYSNNIEIGWKGRFLENRLQMAVTAFYTGVTDAQVPALVLPDAITVTRNTGKLNSRGLELEAAARLAEGLELDYSFGYTYAKYSELKVSSNGDEVNLDGKRQIFTPDVTSMLALQYSVALLPKQQVALVARAEWIYLGQQYFDLANNIRQSPYQLINTRLGVSSRFGEIHFWARNLTKRKYMAYAYDFGAVHIGDPQTMGITITTKF